MQNVSQPQPVVEQFLHLCLRGFWDPPSLEAAVALASQGRLDWAAFRRAAGEEGLSPLLYHVVGGREVVPAPVEKALREAYYRLGGHNTLLLHELKRILCALAAEAVPVLLLKGAALIETAYGNPALRPMVDLDLLVPLAQVGIAHSALAKSGYGMITSDPWPDFSWRYRNSVAYGRPSGRGLPWLVGLHAQAFDVPYYERIPVGDWFGRAQSAPGAGPGARVPAPEDHLVYLCGHLALHHQYDLALLRLVDIALLIQRAGKALDWGQTLDRAVDWRLVIPVQHTLDRLERLWPGTIPSHVALRLARLQPHGSERRVYHWVVGHPRTPASDTLLALGTLPGLARRARFLLEVAFPSPAYMRQRYRPRHPGFWPLTYWQRAGLALQYLLRRLR